MAVNHAVMMRGPVITGRLLGALVLSSLVHALLAELWAGTTGLQPVAANVPLQVRLDTSAASGQARPASSSLLRELDEGQIGQVLPAVRPSPTRAVATPPISVSVKHPAAGRKTTPVEPTAESGADHRFYLARELDHFPVPLLPLSLDLATAGSAADSVRLWVSIDRTGKVLDAVVVAAQAHDAFAQTMRERVLATPFRPAHKDAHAVSSRVLLVLGEGK